MKNIFTDPDRSRLFPLFWMKGEDEARLREGVAEVQAAGCGALVAESRTHPDYLGESWWRDLGIVLDECKKRGMKLWVMDDEHFPSGYGAGAATGTPLRRMMLTERHMDTIGPIPGGAFVVQDDETKFEPGEGIVAVVAARRLEESNRVESLVDIGGFKLGERIDLTDMVHDGMTYWDVPEGIWRIFVLTRRYVAERVPPRYFFNPLLPETGEAIIKTIYEPHFAHFGDEFGKTFMGFFSDEPALRAGRGYHAILGEYPNIPVPWRSDMEQIMQSQLEKPVRAMLPGLWYDVGPDDTRRIRYALMDTASRLYGENFCTPLGNWCRAHGVEYIGHVIEQNNAHCRLGSGAGHFFRAIGGQDMAGIDIVLHELSPIFRNTTHAWKSFDFEADDDFFRFMLMQMAVSSAHLDPWKAGRTMCEIFGAYGWQEDMAQMRYLVNMLLSRGVNYFSPHAFTLTPYPDPDSPPHFDRTAHPLMPHVAQLFRYMAQVGGRIDGGRHLARTGVLYFAEGEWANGSAGCMKTQQVVKALNERQIECEIIPIDKLEQANVDLLLIPYALSWPRKLLEKCRPLLERGVCVRFVDDKPASLSSGTGDMAALLDGLDVIPLADAAALSQRIAPLPYRAACEEARVHVYPYQKEDDLFFLLMNEDTNETIDYRMLVHSHQRPVCIDHEALNCWQPDVEASGDGQIITIRLEPGQLIELRLVDENFPQVEKLPDVEEASVLDVVWRISTREVGSTEWTLLDETKTLYNITAPDHLPRFTGTVRYEAVVDFPQGADGVKLTCAGTAQAWVDGQELRTRMAPPYEFLWPETLHGTHRLTIEITNAPVFRHRDVLSFFVCIPPTGLQQQPALLRRK